MRPVFGLCKNQRSRRFKDLFGQQYLFSDREVCVLREGHPVIRAGMTLEEYLQAEFIGLGISEFDFEVIDKRLAEIGHKRKVGSLWNRRLLFRSWSAQPIFWPTWPNWWPRNISTGFPSKSFRFQLNLTDSTYCSTGMCAIILIPRTIGCEKESKAYAKDSPSRRIDRLSNAIHRRGNLNCCESSSGKAGLARRQGAGCDITLG
jgi:hypothetical protein